MGNTAQCWFDNFKVRATRADVASRRSRTINNARRSTYFVPDTESYRGLRRVSYRTGTSSITYDRCGNVVIGVRLPRGLLPFVCGLAMPRYFRRAYQKDHRFKHDFPAEIPDQGIHVVTPFPSRI
jgi:hypothetical protein